MRRVLLAPSDEMELPNLSRLPAGLIVREYLLTDLDACCDIYRSNLAEFLPDSIELLESHLSDPFSYFLIVQSPTSILACGGLDIHADSNHAGLTFGMVRREFHRTGLGSLLTLTRLALLDGEHDPAFVELETSLAVESFYQRFGFERLSYPEQRYSGGSSYVNMGLSLSMRTRDLIREHLSTLAVSFTIEFPG
jgi:ribosomal protein S18 acetylase RimI-like enzyme